MRSGDGPPRLGQQFGPDGISCGINDFPECSMTATRREFIVGASAAIAAANLPAHAADSADAQAEKLLSEFAEELMVDYPENATSLGVDVGARATLKSKLSDRSAAGQAAIAKRVADRLRRVKAIDTSRLSDATRIDVDVMRTAHEF